MLRLMAFSTVITCSLSNLHPWICLMRQSNVVLEHFYHLVYTLEDLGISSVRILGLCDSVTPMWIFFSLYFLWQIY